MHLLIVTQYFWPETFAINKIVELLAAQGIRVTILTGKPNYPGGNVFPGYRAWGVSREPCKDASIVRIPIFPRGQKSRWRLALNYLSFVMSGLLFGPWLLRQTRFDAVFVYAPSPILQALPAILLARLRKVPLVVWVQDLWPESLSATGHLDTPWILAIVARVVRCIYRASDRILVQSRAFIPPVAALTDKPGKIHYFPNPAIIDAGGQPSERAARLVQDLQQNFCVVFAGNLGAAQGLETIVEAARLLLPHPNIRIVLVGSGSRDEWLAQQRDAHGLSNLVLAGRFDPSDMPAIFNAASALLVTLKPDAAFTLTIPSKLQSYLAAARPIVAALDGEGAKVVEEAGAGFHSAAGDGAALALSIQSMAELSTDKREEMGSNACAYFEENFSPELLIQELKAHLAQAISEKDMK